MVVRPKVLMAQSRRVSWTCPICSRVFLRDVVTARAVEIEPPKRPRGLDSPCPHCGFMDLVLPHAPGDVVLAVTTTPKEEGLAPQESRKGKL